MSFALPIKQVCYSLYLEMMTLLGVSPEVTYQEYIQDKKDIPLNNVFRTTPRHQYCEGSAFITSLSVPEVWGLVALNSIRQAEAEGIEYIIIDDWRRELEKDVIAQHPDINIVTLYLDKEDRPEAVNTTAATASFEGLIDPDKCDVQFTFEKDWSNAQDIENILYNLLTQRDTNA